MPHLTVAEIDQLALDGCEFIGWKSGATVAYDPAGFDRAERIQVTPGELQSKDTVAAKPTPPRPPQARFDAQPYPARIAGFQRRNLFGPDQIGTLISQHHIPWNDGLGNGLYESLRIDRKYGLKHVLEAPILGFPLPYLETDWLSFRSAYAAEINRLMNDLGELEAIYGAGLAKSSQRLMVLWCQHYPLGLFAEAYLKNPDAVEADLARHIGIGVPPVKPVTPVERAQQAHFWCLIRSRLAAVVEAQAEMLRQRLGKDLTLAANPHELPPLDMESQGRAYDYPAVAIRPLLVGDDLLLRYYVAFYTQLYHDLTSKAPMVSVRMNTSAASPRFIPSANLICQWYDQTVRHGAGAFYFWTRDYPYSDVPGTYDGPIPGNPDRSTHAQERWQTVLENLGQLCTHQRFIPPAAEVAILIPNESALLHRQEWRRLHAVFSACCEAGIHTRFVSDRTIRQGVPDGIKLLIAPVLEFIAPELRHHLESFTAFGGRLLLSTQKVWDENGLPDKPLTGAVALEAGAFDIFPLGGQPGNAAALHQLAQYLIVQTDLIRVDRQSWVFDIGVSNLPPSDISLLRQPQADLCFDPWLYEHGSPWIVPYL